MIAKHLELTRLAGALFRCFFDGVCALHQQRLPVYIYLDEQCSTSVCYDPAGVFRRLHGGSRAVF